MKKFLLIFFTLLSTSLFAQNEQCGHQEYLKTLEEDNPGMEAAIERTFFDALTLAKAKTKVSNDTVYEIKVVFHIVYNNDEQNIDDSLIYSQLEVMNDAFRRTNADTVNTRDIFKPVAADTRIQFKMADTDPDGNPTNGIVRKETVYATFGSSPTNLRRSDLVKSSQVGSAPWDTDKYLNIWICDLSANGFDGLLGYAYPPTGADNWNGNGSFADDARQGVVCHYKVVGVGNPAALSTAEKTMVHEVGHYLGLRHIWGDGGCGVDDFMDDTPVAGAASRGCNPNFNGCFRTVPGDLPDMIENYMDYSTGECQNVFTNEQAEQMRANLTTFRSGIYTPMYPTQTFPDVLLDASLVYPNPVYSSLNIYLHDVDEDSDYTIQLTNSLGQVVLIRDLQATSQQKIEGLNGLKGAYVCTLLLGEEVILKKKLLFGL